MNNKGIFGLFKGKKKDEDVIQLQTYQVNEGDEVLTSPMNGVVLPIEKVPDPTFSEKMLGDGIAIEPSDGLVTSPIDGTVEMVFETMHVVGLKTKDGIEFMIHIGIDTVKMKGEGFKAYVKQGDQVKKGDKLIEFDLKLVKKKAPSSITSIVFTSMNQVGYIHLLKDQKVTQQEPLLAVKGK